MLKGLFEIGETIGVEEAFATDLIGPRDEDTVLVISIDDLDAPPTIKEKISFSESNTEEIQRFYYAGGNNSLVGGALGTGGVSPFFLKKDYIKKEKILKVYNTDSEGFDDYYAKKYDGNLIEELFDYLISWEDEIDDLDGEWIYIDEFRREKTLERHRHFINLYIRAPQNQKIDWEKGICNLCNRETGLRDIRLPFFSLDVSNYNFNLVKNRVNRGHLKLCSDCELTVTAGWNYINNIFGNNYALLPELKNGSKEQLKKFIAIANENTGSFETLNNLLEEQALYENLEYTFLVTQKQNQKLNILKKVDNYKTFAQKFENIPLSEGENLKYVDANNIEPPVHHLKSLFDLERILETLFVNDDNYDITNVYGSRFHFYQLYNSDLPQDINPEFKHLLYAHQDEYFSAIYESNPTALQEKTLDNILLNLIKYELRKQETDPNFGEGRVRIKLLNSLNIYFLFQEKLFGGQSMKDKIGQIKEEFEQFDEESKERIKETVNEDKDILYYLIGQFIRKIDDWKYRDNKNKIFGNFIEPLNRKNASERFAKDIIQGQNYYIERLNPKAKFVFDLTASNLDGLFQNQEFPKILIALTSGYYSENILIGQEKQNQEDQNV